MLKSCKSKMATSPHDVCDIHEISSLYIESFWQSSLYIYIIYTYRVFATGGMEQKPLIHPPPPGKILATKFLFSPHQKKLLPPITK